jgi:CheY-like chemotaxis protein
MLFERFLNRAGHQTISVASGVEGLVSAQQQIPDLIMLDLRLHDMNGWDVARTLKSEPRTRHIPVLILTAEPLERELLAAPAFGCEAILLKPFHADIFLDTIAHLLARPY